MKYIYLPWKKKFRAYKFLDEHDIVMIAAEYEGKPFWLAVGTPRSRKTHAAFDIGKEGVGAERDVEKKDLYWEHFVNHRNLPPFLPLEQAKVFMQGTIATASGSISVVTSSSEPTVYESKDTFESVVKELDIPEIKVQEVSEISAKFFEKNVRIELEFPHNFSGSKDDPIWEPIFDFINLMDKPTTIRKATLNANKGNVSVTDNGLNIDLDSGTAQQSYIIFPLGKSIKELRYIDGYIVFEHTHGEVRFEIYYDLDDALFQRED